MKCIQANWQISLAINRVIVLWPGRHNEPPASASKLVDRLVSLRTCSAPEALC